MGMKQLPKRSGECLFEIILRRYETRSTMMTSNRPLEDWGKLLGDVPSATAILDRFLHHAEIVADHRQELSPEPEQRRRQQSRQRRRASRRTKSQRRRQNPRDAPRKLRAHDEAILVRIDVPEAEFNNRGTGWF